MELTVPENCVFLLLVFLGFNYASFTSSAPRNIEEEISPFVISEAVQGTAGRLPCNVTPPVPEDKLALVIWYKEGHSKPIYSVDTRISHFTKGTHWVDDSFDGRASFEAGATPETPAIFTIKSTTNADSGVYRCRVDFQKSPTSSKVKLQVIIPPEKLVILDDTGNHIPHYILGPYKEGSSINITCVSTGVRPLIVKLQGEKRPLSADSSYKLIA